MHLQINSYMNSNFSSKNMSLVMNFAFIVKSFVLKSRC